MHTSIELKSIFIYKITNIYVLICVLKIVTIILEMNEMIRSNQLEDIDIFADT